MKALCSQKEHKYREGYSENGEIKTYKHNQITILKSEIEAIVRSSPGHEDYRYGDEAVVRLDMTCEYIFDRSGYDQIKPAPIKAMLGQSLDKTSSESKSSKKKTSRSSRSSKSKK